MPECTLVALPRHDDARGSLVVAEGASLPFAPQRMFAIYGVPRGATRGDHAHRSCHELITAFGGVTVEVDGGTGARRWRLEGPDQALHVPPGHWISLREFAPGAVCVVLCSHAYDPEDIVSDRATWQRGRA